MLVSAIYSGASYGCEATYVSESHLQHLSSFAVDTLYGDAPRRCNDCVFNMSACEFDPFAEICIRRVACLRRMLSKTAWLASSVSDVISIYLMQGFPGTVPNLWDGPIPTSPHIGDTTRRDWNDRFHSYGPIGFLLHSLGHFGLALSPDLFLHERHEVPSSVLYMPIQYIKPWVRGSIVRARSRFAAKRTCLTDVVEID